MSLKKAFLVFSPQVFGQPSTPQDPSAQSDHLGTVDQGSPLHRNDQGDGPSSHYSIHISPTKILDDRHIRQASIRKAFLAVAVQLPLTFTIVAVLTFVKDLLKFSHSDNWIVSVPLAASTLFFTLLIWCGKIQLKNPWSLMVLSIVTLSLGKILSIQVIPYSMANILIALGITATVCLFVTIFAIMVRCSFTSYFWVSFVGLIALLVLNVLSSFLRSLVLEIVFDAFEILLFTSFLTAETQLVLGNNPKTFSFLEYLLAGVTYFVILILMVFDTLDIAFLMSKG
ncbi:protein lifeguard 1-like [Hemicordylus capensis]|uniref:protein lifeguard 1-like n=1 Tax=Hemicordylus capensis TaxID=884348 RepID=UPI0023044C6D|nr:protein lifeguard 1-like [Hemicordylus capensis]XP_053107157.1 protein lifeguard 1-like [Hemicordylus capensis]